MFTFEFCLDKMWIILHAIGHSQNFCKSHPIFTLRDIHGHPHHRNHQWQTHDCALSCKLNIKYITSHLSLKQCFRCFSDKCNVM